MHTAVTKAEDTKPQDVPRPLADFVSECKITRPGRVSASSQQGSRRAGGEHRFRKPKFRKRNGILTKGARYAEDDVECQGPLMRAVWMVLEAGRDGEEAKVLGDELVRVRLVCLGFGRRDDATGWAQRIYIRVLLELRVGGKALVGERGGREWLLDALGDGGDVCRHRGGW